MFRKDINIMVSNLNKHKEKLTKVNKEVFDDVILYLRTSGILEKDIEIILQELLDLFLHPENIEKPISEIIGTDDYKGYLDSIIKEKKSTLVNQIKEAVVIFLGGFLTCNLFLYIGDVFINYIKTSNLKMVDYDFKIYTIIVLVFSLFLPYGLFKAISKGLFKFKNNNKVQKSKFKSNLISFGIVYIGLICFMGVLYAIDFFLKAYVKIVLFSIPGIYILSLGGVNLVVQIYLIVRLWRKRQ